MGSNVEREVYRYSFNLFCFPKGYFKQRSAEELKISEEARQKLIEMQSKHFGENE